MRLISLNLWWGKVHDPLLEFIKTEAPKTDVFCFQEMVKTDFENSVSPDKKRIGLYEEVKSVLSDFQDNFCLIQVIPELPTSLYGETTTYGLAMFVRRSIAVESFGNFSAHGERNEYSFVNPPRAMPAFVQHVTLTEKNKKYTICNFHGISIWPKVDTPERLEQSAAIRKFLGGILHAKIFCGDFNLSPDTKSLALLEEGNTNVVKKYKISRTRSRLLKNSTDTLSDYILVSPDIAVEKLVIPDIAVSDHLPLIFDFH